MKLSLAAAPSLDRPTLNCENCEWNGRTDEWTFLVDRQIQFVFGGRHHTHTFNDERRRKQEENDNNIRSGSSNAEVSYGILQSV